MDPSQATPAAADTVLDTIDNRTEITDHGPSNHNATIYSPVPDAMTWHDPNEWGMTMMEPHPSLQLNAQAAPFLPQFVPPPSPPHQGMGPPCPPLVGHPMMPPPPPLPYGGRIEQVGILGGIHYHGVHHHQGVQMDELKQLLQSTVVGKPDHHHKKDDEEPTALLKEVLGYVQEIRQQQQLQPVTVPDNHHTVLLQEILTQVQALQQSQSQEAPDIAARVQEVLETLESTRCDLVNVLSAAGQLLKTGLQDLEAVAVQQHDDSAVLSEIRTLQEQFHTLLLENNVPTGNRGLSNGSHGFHTNNAPGNKEPSNKKKPKSHRGGGRGHHHHGQENRFP